MAIYVQKVKLWYTSLFLFKLSKILFWDNEHKNEYKIFKLDTLGTTDTKMSTKTHSDSSSSLIASSESKFHDNGFSEVDYFIYKSYFHFKMIREKYH